MMLIYYGFEGHFAGRLRMALLREIDIMPDRIFFDFLNGISITHLWISERNCWILSAEIF